MDRKDIVVNYRVYDVLEDFYLEDLLEDRREYSISDLERGYPYLKEKECKAIYYYIALLISKGYNVNEWFLRIREDIRDSKVSTLISRDIEEVVLDIGAEVSRYLEIEMVDLREDYILLEGDRKLFLLGKARTALGYLIEEYGGEKEFK